jgi:hypothetical protein
MGLGVKRVIWTESHQHTVALFDIASPVQLQTKPCFFCPRTRIGFGFPASRGVFTKLEYLILNHPLAKVR